MAEGWDDEALLAGLKEALGARRAVPPDFVEAGKNAFAWHNIDAELASLTYDSAQDSDHMLVLRAESASVRALTFSSPHLTIELEVTPDALVGQVIPAQAMTITVQPRTGEETELATDEIGCFSIHPIPAVTFRLHCRAAPDIDVVTGWVTL